jgi:hypothetical protein
VLPDGVKLASLREAIAHLVKTVPKAERRMSAVLTAAELAEYASLFRPTALLREADISRLTEADALYPAQLSPRSQ